MLAKHLAPALACVAALSTLPAAAGPSQGGINPPGGFVSACATDLSSGQSYLPGGDLLYAFSAYPARTSCRGQYYGGTAGSTAAASYATSTVQSQSSAAVTMGAMWFGAATSAPNISPHPVAAGGAGWSDSLVVDLAGRSGEAAIWRYTMRVGGSMASGGFSFSAVMLSAFKNEEELFGNVAGFHTGASDAIGTDRQRVGWAATYGTSRVVKDVVTFAVPVTLGQSFVWGVYASAYATVGKTTAGGNGATQLDFSDGLQYGGSDGLYLGGLAMDGYTLQSASGIDWMQAAAVPEPGTWALWSAGLLGVLVMRLRRRSERQS